MQVSYEAMCLAEDTPVDSPHTPAAVCCCFCVLETVPSVDPSVCAYVFSQLLYQMAAEWKWSSKSWSSDMIAMHERDHPVFSDFSSVHL